ncbi:MAG: peptide chain release factor N(5)-glutamine methyltransferase [Candidatus Omnitrophota bacterium]
MIATVKPFTPIQYIIGRTEFCGLDLVVDERVLIPRPETELVVGRVIDILKGPQSIVHSPRLLDLCTGSGNIAIALTKSVTQCKIIASDISEEALAVAQLNAGRFGVREKIEFVKSDLFDDIEGEFDIVVSNPPYVARREFDGLQREVLQEPRIAIDGGEDGLDFYRKILRDGPRHLKRDGLIVFEIGYGQLDGILGIAKERGRYEPVDIVKDHNGIERVLTLKWISC